MSFFDSIVSAFSSVAAGASSAVGSSGDASGVSAYPSTGAKIWPLSAVMREEMKKGIVYNMKVVLRGMRGTGKTTLLSRLSGHPMPSAYQPSQEISATTIRLCGRGCKPHEGTRVDIWDVVDEGHVDNDSDGSQRGRSGPRRSAAARALPLPSGKNQDLLRHQLELLGTVADARTIDVYQGCHLAIFLIDPLKPASLEYAVREAARVPYHTCVVLALNFCDVPRQKRMVPFSEVEAACRQLRRTATPFVTELMEGRSPLPVYSAPAMAVTISAAFGTGIAKLVDTFNVPNTMIRIATWEEKVQALYAEMSTLTAALTSQVGSPPGTRTGADNDRYNGREQDRSIAAANPYPSPSSAPPPPLPSAGYTLLSGRQDEALSTRPVSPQPAPSAPANPYGDAANLRQGSLKFVNGLPNAPSRDTAGNGASHSVEYDARGIQVGFFDDVISSEGDDGEGIRNGADSDASMMEDVKEEEPPAYTSRRLVSVRPGTNRSARLPTGSASAKTKPKGVPVEAPRELTKVASLPQSVSRRADTPAASETVTTPSSHREGATDTGPLQVTPRGKEEKGKEDEPPIPPLLVVLDDDTARLTAEAQQAAAQWEAEIESKIVNAVADTAGPDDDFFSQVTPAEDPFRAPTELVLSPNAVKDEDEAEISAPEGATERSREGPIPADEKRRRRYRYTQQEGQHPQAQSRASHANVQVDVNALLASMEATFQAHAEADVAPAAAEEGPSVAESQHHKRKKKHHSHRRDRHSE